MPSPFFQLLSRYNKALRARGCTERFIAAQVGVGWFVPEEELLTIVLEAERRAERCKEAMTDPTSLTDQQRTILRAMVKKDLDASRSRLLRGLAGTGVEGEEVLNEFWAAVRDLASGGQP
jgi:hypothetical protein